MIPKNLKLAQSLFSILASALLASACSDSTGPTTVTHVDQKKPAPVDTSRVPDPPSDVPAAPPSVSPPALPSGTPPTGSAEAPQAALQRGAPGMAKVPESGLSSLMGDLYPCWWSGDWCLRWVDLNDPVWLHLAVLFSGDYVFIWEQVSNTGTPWQFQYAMNRDGSSLWTWTGQGWHLYQPNDVQIDPTHVVIGAPDGCGMGVLCTSDMLNPAKQLWNGMSVVEFRRRIATGT